MKNLKIGRKFGLSFGIMLFLLAGSAIVGIVTAVNSNNRALYTGDLFLESVAILREAVEDTAEIDAIEERVASVREGAEAAITRTTLILALVGIGAISGGVFLALYLSRLVAKPLKIVSEMLHSVAADGDIEVSADETAASLKEIVAGIGESSQLVDDIAKSSEEQAEAITQINRGVDQVTQVIQQTSATAEESAAASEEMSGQSQMLEELIARFKLKGDGGIGLISQNLLAPALAAPVQVEYNESGGKY